MEDRIVVLHLRAASDSGGGPEKTIYNTGRFIDSKRFLYLIAYLKKNSSDLSLISQNITKAGLNYFEFAGGSFIDRKQLSQIVHLVRKHGVQIIHSHDPKTDFYGLLLKLRFPKLKLVSTMHGWIHRTWKSAFYNKLDMYVLRCFHIVIAVSGSIEKTAKRFGLSNTCLIYNAVDTNEWKPVCPAKYPKILQTIPRNSQSFVVGYVGRLSKEKGPMDFIKTAQKILKKDINCEFVVAGDGPEMEAMKGLAEATGIIGKVHFLGHVNRDDMISVYQKLNLLLSTSKTEGFPNNILEALAMSVPVVSTNVGGVNEIITNDYNGLLAEKDNIDKLTIHVTRIKNDKALADRLIKHGRLTAENKFSFDARVNKLEKLYQNLIQV
jgi:glycosyltransferase involved in cell wall biosynthesis